jgi:hypothetical protein
MNKKTALTILVVVIIVAILVIGFFLFFQKQSEQKNSVIDAARNFFGGFFPTSPTTNSNNSQINDNQNNNPINNVIPRLRQISNFPVAGGVMFERTATTSSLLVQDPTASTTNAATSTTQKITEVVYRFVERATGHIYETTSRDLSQKRITNTTIPKDYEAFFSNDGESLAMIYLDPQQAIETFLGKINYPKDATTTNSTTTISYEKNELDDFANITGTFLPIESFGFTKSQTSNDFAFLNRTDSADGGYVVNLYTGNLKTPLLNKNVYSLNTSEWKIQILKDGTLALNTKPSVVSDGFLYFLNPKEGILRKKLGNTKALTSLVSPDGKKIFYSYNDAGTTKTVIYDSTKKIYTSLNLATLASDKCVWSPKDSVSIYCAVPTNLIRGDFPDDWYQGKYAFDDSLVKINTDDFTVETLMQANTETQTNLDIVNLQTSPNEDYLMFMNKTDLILWSLDIL